MSDRDNAELTEYWRRETMYVNVKIDDAFKNAQDHAYALGLKRGRQQVCAPVIVDPLTNEQISAIAEGMPGGIDGFCKGWGWQQFAKAIESEHGIGVPVYDDGVGS